MLIRHLTAAVLVAVLCFAAVGCDAEKTPTTQNMTGGWEGLFGDTAVVFNLYPDGTYDVELDPDRSRGSQLYFNSGFSRVGDEGLWRLQDNEVVFSNGEKTVGGLLITSMTDRQVLLKTFDDQVMFFSPVALPGKSSGFVVPSSDEDEDETTIE